MGFSRRGFLGRMTALMPTLFIKRNIETKIDLPIDPIAQEKIDNPMIEKTFEEIYKKSFEENVFMCTG
jgi:hypothetical protein